MKPKEQLTLAPEAARKIASEAYIYGFVSAEEERTSLEFFNVLNFVLRFRPISLYNAKGYFERDRNAYSINNLTAAALCRVCIRPKP